MIEGMLDISSTNRGLERDGFPHTDVWPLGRGVDIE